jgi:hypothetical protein
MNMHDKNLEEGIFPINSPLPQTNRSMSVRLDSSNEDVRLMEKECFALNLTSTIAYSLGVNTPYTNIGNVIPLAIFFNSSTNITDNIKDLVLTYHKNGM